MWNQTNTTKVCHTNHCHYFTLWIKGSSHIKTHNIITDNCKKIRPEYQPTTVWMSELKAVLEMTTTHLHTSWNTTACGASWNRRCTKHASLILTTSNIALELSGPRWITLSLLQLCVSGVDVFQLVWRWVVVILSTAFNSDVQAVVSWYSGLIFLQLSVMTLCILIHDDPLIHKVK